MKPVSDRFFEQVRVEPRLASVTEEGITAALEGFPLELKQSMGWLTEAVRNVLFVSLTPLEDGPERQTNAVTKKELAKLAAEAGAVWAAIFDRSPGAEDALFAHAWQGWEPPVGTVEIDGIPLAEPPAHKRFNKALAELDWLASFLRNAANGLESERGPWKTPILREERIYRAQCLSPVYEKAFHAIPTINTWGIEDRDRKKPESYGHWADFYQRIVKLAFGEGGTPDLEGVLDTARRRHIDHRIELAPGIIPKG